MLQVAIGSHFPSIFRGQSPQPTWLTARSWTERENTSIARRRTSGLYLQVRPLPEGRSSKPDSQLQVEIAGFKETLPLGVQRGWFDSYEVAFETPHPVAIAVADTIRGYAVAVAIGRGGARYVTLFYVYPLQGMLVTIRLTVPAEGWASNPVLDVPVNMVRLMAETVRD